MSDTSKPRPLWQKVFVIVSGLAFLGTMTLPMLSALKGTQPSANNSAQPNPGAAPTLDQIKAIETGYEKVLLREPNNVTALQGLAQSRLKRGDLKGGLVPLKKLSTMFPEEKELAKLVTAIEKQLKSPGSPPPASK